MSKLFSGTEGALEINTADVADDAITLAKMAPGTDGQIITYDASGNPSAVGPGTDGQVLTSTGAGSPPAFENAAGRTYGTEIDANSTSEEFTSLPSGLSQIIIYFENVSWSGTVTGTVVIGDNGGYETSGYLGDSTQHEGTNVHDATGSTSEWVLRTGNGAGAGFSGVFVMDLMESSTNTWMQYHMLIADANSYWVHGAGMKSLSGTLDRVKMSGGTFDAGRFQISYS